MQIESSSSDTQTEFRDCPSNDAADGQKSENARVATSKWISGRQLAGKWKSWANIKRRMCHKWIFVFHFLRHNHRPSEKILSMNLWIGTGRDGTESASSSSLARQNSPESSSPWESVIYHFALGGRIVFMFIMTTTARNMGFFSPAAQWKNTGKKCIALAWKNEFSMEIRKNCWIIFYDNFNKNILYEVTMILGPV